MFFFVTALVCTPSEANWHRVCFASGFILITKISAMLFFFRKIKARLELLELPADQITHSFNTFWRVVCQGSQRLRCRARSPEPAAVPCGSCSQVVSKAAALDSITATAETQIDRRDERQPDQVKEPKTGSTNEGKLSSLRRQINKQNNRGGKVGKEEAKTLKK